MSSHDLAEQQSDTFRKIVFLNHITSRSSTHAPREFHAPALPALELLEILNKRRLAGWAFEFYGVKDVDDEEDRKNKGIGHSFLRLKELSFENSDHSQYAVLFFEYLDKDEVGFPVVHRETYEGREISGDEGEHGAFAAHMVIKLKDVGEYDDGVYRCVVEHSPGISRKNIAGLLCTQLRRHTKTFEYTFSVSKSKGMKPPKPFTYKFTPRLELRSDVGRSLAGAIAGQELSMMVFTKRSEKQNLSGETEVYEEEVYADVEIRIAAKQGPDDPQERLAWSDKLRSLYAMRGFESKMYFKHASGETFSGAVDSHIEGAADLLMCPKEWIDLSSEPKRWRAGSDQETVARMKELLEKDELWARAK